MAATITVDELLAELTRLGVGETPESGGYTKKQLMKMWNLTDGKADELIDKSLAAGLATSVQVTFVNRLGVTTSTGGYRFTLPEKTPAKARK